MTKKRSKIIKLYWWSQSFWNAIFCTPKLHLGVTAISTSISAVVFLLVGIAGWYNLNINCNQNIHYANKLSYLHFLGSCVGGGGLFFTWLPSFTNLISKKPEFNVNSIRGDCGHVYVIITCKVSLSCNLTWRVYSCFLCQFFLFFFTRGNGGYLFPE